MENLFKKAFYTGVGLVNNTAGTVRNSVEDLVKKGKLSEEEGKKVVADMEENLSEKREEFEAVLTNVVGVALAKLNLPTAESIKGLEKRIKSLEIKVGLLSKELDEKATPAKKTTTRKTTVKAAVKKVADKVAEVVDAK